jgi:CheY-like chemotaxis protein
MAAALAQIGISCETSSSGEEALRILETHRMDAVILNQLPANPVNLQMPADRVEIEQENERHETTHRLRKNI